MKYKLFKSKGGLFVALVLLTALFAVTAVYAEGNVTFDQSTAKYRLNDIEGNSLTGGTVLQLFNAQQIEFFSSKPNSPLQSPNSLTPVKYTNGDNTPFFGEQGTSLWVRTWQGARYNSNYGYQSRGFNDDNSGAEEDMYLPAPPATPSNYHIKSFRTNFRTDAPPPPNVSAGTPSYAEKIVNGKKTLIPYVTIFISNSSPGSYEVKSYYLKIWKYSDQSKTAIIEKSVTGDYTTDYNTEPLEFGITYEASAYTVGWFAVSNYKDPPASFETVSMGAVGAFSFPLTFESQAPNGPGMNFFSMPTPPDENGNWYAFNATDGKPLLFYNSSNTITTALDMVRAINSAAG